MHAHRVVSLVIVALLVSVFLIPGTLADFPHPINIVNSWKGTRFGGVSGNIVNVTVATQSGKPVVASGFACASSIPTSMVVVDQNATSFVNALTVDVNSGSKCHGIMAFAASAHASSKVSLIWSVSGSSFFASLIVAQYTNVSALVALGSSAGNMAGTTVLLPISVPDNGSWFAAFGMVQSCGVPPQTTWPGILTTLLPNMVSRQQVGTDTSSDECSRYSDSNAVVTAGATNTIQLTDLNAGADYLLLAAELQPIVTRTVIIGGVDVFGVFSVLTFLCILGIGVYGAWEVRKRYL